MMNGCIPRQQNYQHAVRPSHTEGVRILSRTHNQLIVEVFGEASHCLDQVGEDDPAILLDWDLEKVRAAVALANRVRPPLPFWMIEHYEYPIKVSHFQYFSYFQVPAMI